MTAHRSFRSSHEVTPRNNVVLLRLLQLYFMRRNRYPFLLSFFLIVFPFLSPALAQCPVISALPDTLEACKNTVVSLNPVLTGGSATPQDTTWTPAAGLSNPNIINPTATMGTASAKYVLTIPAIEAYNAVLNGNFSAGNTGFTSSYSIPTLPYGTWGPLSYEATYTVTTNPNLAHTNFASFSDHTGDLAALMMVINGSSVANTPIWCQTITVTPNTDYDFSAWGATCVNSNPAILQFRINGVLVGTPLSLPLTTGVWTQFHTVWNSGSNTSASICIVDQQTATSGNDFALDDITFRKVCSVKDSVYIRVTNLTPSIDHELMLGCDADTVSLLALNGAGTVPAAYTWHFGDGATGSTAAISHAYTAQGNYTIKLVTEKSGCKDSSEVSINTEHPLLAGFSVNKDTICAGGTILFSNTSTVSGPATYLLDFGDGSSTTATSATHTYNTPGAYPAKLIATDTLHCTDTAFKTIYVWANDVYDNKQPAVICHGETFMWGGEAYTATGVYPKTFTNRHGCDSAMLLQLTVLPAYGNTVNTGFCQGKSFAFAGNTYTAPGNYTITLTSATNCDSIVTLNLQQWPSPVITIPDTICKGSSYEFAGNSYTTAGTYTHVFTTANGCDSTIILKLEVNEKPDFRFIMAAESCPGKVETMTLVETYQELADNYNWDFGTAQILFGAGGGPYGFTWQQTGWHYITLSEFIPGCGLVSFTDSIFIHPLPDAQILSATDVFCARDTVTLVAATTPGYKYQWQPASWVTEGQGSSTVRIRLQRSDWIKMTVTNSGGCQSTDSIYIAAENCCTLEMPSAFSPNGDGRNDVFRPITMGHQEIAHFRIYNRWGQVVYESRQSKQGWDGTFNGQVQDIGTYMYSLSYRCADGKLYEKKGEVLLLR